MTGSKTSDRPVVHDFHTIYLLVVADREEVGEGFLRDNSLGRPENRYNLNEILI